MTTTKQKWTSRVLSGIAVLFLLIDAMMKVLQMRSRRWMRSIM